MVKFHGLKKKVRTPQEIEQDLLDAIEAATETQQRILRTTSAERRKAEKRRFAAA